MKKIIFFFLLIFSLVSFTSCGEHVDPTPTEDESLVEFKLNYVYIKNNAAISSAGGSFATFKYNGYEFAAYRAYAETGGTALYPYTYTRYSKAQNGTLANITAFPDVRKIVLKYKCEGIASFNYGNNSDKNNTIQLESKPSYEEVTLNLTNTNYFSIETVDNNFYLKELTIGFKDQEIEEPAINTPLNPRINPYKTLSDAKDLDTVTLPISYVYDDGKLALNEFRTYTYYSKQYIIAHPELASAALCLDPVDVANYYIAFHDFPVNYAYKEDLSDISYLFGSKMRLVQKFSGQYGYATSVPYNTSSTGSLAYYEFDIALNEAYSTSSRGAGRVVMWEYGFNYTGYDLQPVAVYTDDHYYTFQEFNNLGSFSERFDAENPITFRSFSSTTFNLF